MLLRWILEILHDPRYLMPWEFWEYGTFRSCRIFSINSIKIPPHNIEPPPIGFGVWGLGFRVLGFWGSGVLGFRVGFRAWDPRKICPKYYHKPQ